MSRFTTPTRIALCLTLLSLNAVIVASMLNLFPNERAIYLQGRVAFCESLAISCSGWPNSDDHRGIQQLMNSLVQRNEDIRAAVLRNALGRTVVCVGECDSLEVEAAADRITVPITARHRTWGHVEVIFRPLPTPNIFGWPLHVTSFTRFTLFVTAFNGIAFALWLRRMLVHLDPSRVVPSRVRAALDTLAEGLLVLDQSDASPL